MKTPSFLVGLAACALIGSTLMAAAPSSQAAAQQQAGSPADDPDAELFSQMCSRCHDGARITAMRRTKSEWEQVLTKMITMGATGSEDEFQTVFGFLRRHYGKVYINTAVPDEITTSLGPLHEGRGRHPRLPQGQRPLPGFRGRQEGPGPRRQDARRAQGRRRVLTPPGTGPHVLRRRLVGGVCHQKITARPCQKTYCFYANKPRGGSRTL